jgi:hypothetical protein
MRFVTKLGVFLLLGVLVAACGGDKKDGGAILSPGTSPSSSGGTTTTSGTGTPGALGEMSLVYVDSRDGTPHLFVAKSDGSSPRKVIDLPPGSRAIDLRNNVLLAGGDSLVLVDLRDGKMVDIKPGAAVRDARFIDNETVVFSTAGSGCPPTTKPTLQSYSTKDGMKKELYAGGFTTITIAGVGKDGTVAFAPRGCDVGISQVLTLNAKTGGAPADVKPMNMGCGWVIASPETMDAVVSWKSCTAPDSKDATVYSLGTTNTRAPKDLKAPAGGSNAMPWVLRPGGKEAALATAQSTGTGPGSTRSSGIWLVDLRTGDFKDLAPAAGAEQFPVSWTADGRYLLAASVQAQGVCSYSVIDANEKKVAPLPEALTFCGPNGVVLGLTVIR